MHKVGIPFALRYKIYQFVTSLLFIFTFNISIFSQTYNGKLELRDTNITKGNNLQYIKICRWKNSAKVATIFAFYDNCSSQNKISRLFDQYGIKGTFFINPQWMSRDSLMDMSLRGHEIGNHTYSHPHLSELDSLHLDTEIRKSKLIIDSVFGVKCVSFAEPFSSRSSLSIKTALKYHLFLRDYQKYPENKHVIYTISPKASLVRLNLYLKMAYDKGTTLEIEGHGIDGEGYEPISKELLSQFLNTIKKHSDVGDFWVTTYKECGSYENLYREIVLDRTQNGDTVTLKFKNYDKVKYKDMKSSPISVEIPYYLSNELRCITDSVEVKELKSKFVATIDLKRDTTLVLVLKGINESSNSLNKINQRSLFFYPNPVNDVLNLRCVGEILRIEIYDMSGNRHIALTSNVSSVDVSHLSKGSYLIYVKSKNENSIVEYKAKFFKI